MIYICILYIYTHIYSIVIVLARGGLETCFAPITGKEAFPGRPRGISLKLGQNWVMGPPKRAGKCLSVFLHPRFHSGARKDITIR